MADTVGQQLKQKREARSLNIEQASRETRIRVYYLQAIEDCNYQSLPSSAQTRGFVRAYAGYLGLNPETILEALSIEIPALAVSPSSAPLKTIATGYSRKEEFQKPARQKSAAEVAVPPAGPAGSQVQKIDESSPQPAEEVLPAPVEITPGASTIFADIGHKLHTQRELLGLSLEDVERHTHLRLHYLNALETGDLKGLPSPVQGRGMLNNYASFLGLDPEPLLLRFAEGLQSKLAARQQESASQKRPATPAAPAASGRRMFSGELFLGSILIVFLLGFVLWGSVRILNLRNGGIVGNLTLTPRSISDVLLSTPAPDITPALTESSLPATPALTSTQTTGQPIAFITATGISPDAQGTAVTPAPDSHAAVQVNIVVRLSTWMRIRADDKVVFDGRVVPGSAYQYNGDQRVEILTGDGSSLQVFYNGTDMGLLGAFGEVIDRIFTPTAMLTPTPTITPTGMKPPTATTTPPGAPTATSRVTPTRSPAPGASATATP